MRASLFLRIASVISTLTFAGHTLGGRRDWSPMGDNEVLEAMKGVRFEPMGVSRTYLDFYRGFGLSLSVFLLAQAIVLWQLAPLTTVAPGRTKHIIATFVLASLACTIIAWVLILPLPAILSAVLTVCLALAYLRMPRRPTD
jgi:hypothetical protein